MLRLREAFIHRKFVAPFISFSPRRVLLISLSPPPGSARAPGNRWDPLPPWRASERARKSGHRGQVFHTPECGSRKRGSDFFHLDVARFSRLLHWGSRKLFFAGRKLSVRAATTGSWKDSPFFFFLLLILLSRRLTSLFSQRALKGFLRLSFFFISFSIKFLNLPFAYINNSKLHVSLCI